MTDNYDADSLVMNLAIEGGQPVRDLAMPTRNAIGENEKKMILESLDYYESISADPGYQGVFEERYCDAFVKMMGGGYADAVATGTVSLYIALAALELPTGSEVIVSPITDPGTISAIILQGLVPVPSDTIENNYNIGPEQIERCITSRTSCILLVHAVGYAAPIEQIMELAKKNNLSVLEDCSQAHGAMFNDKRVGTFGDIAAFSTMYRKASISGASGGIVYSKNKDIFNKALAHADRGKPRWIEGFDDRDPAQFLFPALNLHTDELSCAIGIASVNRLDETRIDRLNFVSELRRIIESESKVCVPYGYNKNASPFIYPIIVDESKISVSKTEFAMAVRAEGIDLNPHYKYLITDWPWAKKYYPESTLCPNAASVIERSFNVYLNENYTKSEAMDAANAILKVEKFYIK